MPLAPSFAAMFTTEDGIRIDAAHTPPRGAGDLGIVLAHGFTGSLRERPTRRITHVLSGFGGVVSFDFRGHGRSGGESTVGDLEILDLDAAVRHARTIGYIRVAVVGFSMGAAVAVRHAGRHGQAGAAEGHGRPRGGPDAVVAVSAPARWYYRGTRPMRQVHWAIEQPLGRWAARVGKRTRIRKGVWDPVPSAPYEAAAHIAPTPLLVVHGDADGFFPLDHAYQIYEAAREPKELWVEPGYGHAESAATPGLIRRIGEWVCANS
ncbi:alpha/beta hydrolase [Streptosporangium sp. NBC_01756]|uniref:alpha/beta hydrolase n=1 Tax=Streptosporangium sp. NBC_01756 TaxID=2975950 RepID=UPI002DD84CCE|nr:alpha/beta fold hydrolase [Streptosporangium sp. NBC_01756]WSC88754.1 lysophospholipase [Streptosporangium sp. NBC_01756]